MPERELALGKKQILRVLPGVIRRLIRRLIRESLSRREVKQR